MRKLQRQIQRQQKQKTKRVATASALLMQHKIKAAQQDRELETAFRAAKERK
ncbi:hypothetical protein ACQRBN_06665 [Bariatricus sp. SGI.154]|uniref:hypothetical protein n=1 Tax=Bariatricus sp. SGI.154 TaxID=3420549 RepID=UPI003CFDE254